MEKYLTKKQQVQLTISIVDNILSNIARDGVEKNDREQLLYILSVVAAKLTVLRETLHA